MADWHDVYRTDIDYVLFYCTELNPVRATLPLLCSGLVPPKIRTACELGFGFGVSTNIHAAASNVEWYGTDFNPGQTSYAREMAEASGAKIHLYDESFADFCSRTDLPDFDYIGLHGIWNWVGAENRNIMVDFIRRKLKAGGLAYISYNCLPGQTHMIPVQELLNRYARTLEPSGRGITANIKGAVAFAEKLFALNPGYAIQNPEIVEHIKRMKKHSTAYLAGEYFNGDWAVPSHATVAEHLAKAKLDFVCSARYLSNMNELNFPENVCKFLADIPDISIRQTVRDFITNEQFRQDYWIRGPRHLQKQEIIARLRQQRILLALDRNDVSLKIRTNRGEASLPSSEITLLLDILNDHKPHSLAEIEKNTEGRITFNQIVKYIMILVGKGDVFPVQEDVVIAEAKPVTDRFNQYIMQQSMQSDALWLASPASGGAVCLNRLQQLFLLAHKQGLQPSEWADFVWQLFSRAGCGCIKDGKALPTREENIAELTRVAREFAEKTLPSQIALQVV